MQRRDFFKIGGLTSIGAVISPYDLLANNQTNHFKHKKAKNIIFMVSDGMSSGTFNLANMYSERILGKKTNWIDLYEKNKVTRGLMDMASASSIVTDSSAASSSWGGGERVNNGSINISPSGKEIMPIWQKFKQKGKLAGCVTTVPITHATPAGFTVSLKSRNNQEYIAEQYLEIGFDVLLGGGKQYFTAENRKDKVDLLSSFSERGYFVAKNKNDLKDYKFDKKILGVFDLDALPYAIDREQSIEISNAIPTLAEMTKIAIEAMKDNEEGFVLQIESGKVDWAAHANDVSGLIHEQLQFDEAIKTVMDFAEKDEETLVIITTDHGNANPGLIYGKNADKNFDSLVNYKFTNEYVLNNISANFNSKQVQEFINYTLKINITTEEANTILNYYSGLSKEDNGLYNYRKLPFNAFAQIQKNYNSIGWISMDHSADYVEIAMFGPGNYLHKPFMKNTDLHYLMLEAAEIENKF